MGTHLTIKLKDRNQKNIDKFNQLWIDFARDLELPEDYQNYYGSKNGHVLYFESNRGIEEWSENVLFNEKVLDHLGFKELRNREDLTREQKVKEGVKILKKQLSYWCETGKAEIKLSGSHYCCHLLRRVYNFIVFSQNALIPDTDWDGWKDLENNDLIRWINYKEIIGTSSYCRICKEKAQRQNINLPLFPRVGNKNQEFIAYEDNEELLFKDNFGWINEKNNS